MLRSIAIVTSLLAPGWAFAQTVDPKTLTDDQILKSWGLSDQTPPPADQIGSKPEVASNLVEGPGCYTISRGPTEAQTLLLNRCNGNTWILVRQGSETSYKNVWEPVLFLYAPVGAK